MALSSVEVEFCKAVGSEERHEERQICEPSANIVVPKECHEDESGSDTTCDQIGKRVKFFAERRGHIEQACSHAVEEVEEYAKADE